MKGLIISNGTINDYNRLKSEIDASDFVICADGGIEHLIKLKIVPNLVLGDLDSISQLGLKFIKDNNIPINKFPAIKDDTDTALALDYMLDQGFNEITFMGVTGTRMDHTLANILLLITLLERGIRGKIVDDNNIIQLVDKYLEIKYRENTFVSIIPISEEGVVVSLEGFFYNLDKETIKLGSTYGISNRIVKDYGKIEIHKGKALVFISND